VFASATPCYRSDAKGATRSHAEATALFVVEHGKITLWDQIGLQLVVGH
jgi:hypothetical protein